MRIKKANFHWYILQCRNNKMLMVDVFNSKYYAKDIAKQIKKGKIRNKKDLKEWIRRQMMYYYWSKCEAEFKAGGLFVEDDEKMNKIDGYFQILPNLDIMTDMVINEMRIDFKER